MKTLLKSPKNTFLIIFHRYGHFRPIPATNQIGKIKKIIKKSQKMRFFKNPYSVIYSGRKYDIWPEIDSLDPGKPLESLYWPSYTIWSNFKKNQKNPIFDLQNQKKNFFGRLLRPMWPGRQNNIGDQNIISVPQRPYNVTLPPHPLHTYIWLQIFTGSPKNQHFFTKVLFLLLLLLFGCC